MSKRTNIPDNKSILQRMEAELAQSSGTEYGSARRVLYDYCRNGTVQKWIVFC